jgi:hypothetical protein
MQQKQLKAMEKMKRILFVACASLASISYGGAQSVNTDIVVDSTTVSLSVEGLKLLNYQLKGRTLPQLNFPSDMTKEDLYRTPADGCYYGIGDDKKHL